MPGGRGPAAGAGALWVVERPLEARIRAVRTLVTRHRRLLAAVCAGAAVLVTVSALTAPSESPPGDGVGATSARAASLPARAGALPVAGAARVAVTVRLADPAGLLLLRTGSHVEVVGGAPTGTTAAGVAAGSARSSSDPSSDPPRDPSGDPPGSSSGDSGSAAWAGTDGAEVLAADAVVLDVPRPPASAPDAGTGLLDAGSGGGTGTSGLDGVVVLAVTPSAAHRLAAAAGVRPLSVTVALPRE